MRTFKFTSRQVPPTLGIEYEPFDVAARSRRDFTELLDQAGQEPQNPLTPKPFTTIFARPFIDIQPNPCTSTPNNG